MITIQVFQNTRIYSNIMFSSKQTWFDVNGQGGTKEIHTNMILQKE